MQTLLTNCSENREEWLKLREKTIGASEAYDAADIDEDSNPLRVYLKLAGKAEPIEDNEPMYYGRKLENFVGQEFCQRYIDDNPGAVVILDKPDTLLAHDKHPYLTCTPDFYVTINGERCLLETKTTNERNLGNWEENKVPSRARTQVLHQLGICDNIHRAFVGAFIYKPTFRYSEVQRDDEVIEEITRREKSLYDLALSGGSPPLKNATSEQIRTLFWKSDGTELLLEESQYGKFFDLYLKLAAEEKVISEQKKKASNLILALASGHNAIRCGAHRATIVRNEYDSIDMTEVKIKEHGVYLRLLKQYPKHIKAMYPRITARKGEL